MFMFPLKNLARKGLSYSFYCPRNFFFFDEKISDIQAKGIQVKDISSVMACDI